MDDENHVSVDATCRTCLASLNHVAAFDLFAVPGLAKKLCVCTSLSVEQFDGYPKNLCSHCYNRLNDLHDFQKQCVDSVQKFKELLVKNDNLVDTYEVHQFAEVPVEEEEGINFDPLLSTKVEIVENEIDAFEMLATVDQEPEDLENEAKSASSDEDNEDVNEDADFDANISDSDDSMPLSRLRSGDSPTKTVAKRNVKAKSNAETPKKTSGRQPSFECHICRQNFKVATRYDDHMKHHNDELPFQCSVETCKKGFKTAAGLRHHVDHTHWELCTLHPCTVEGCDKSFPRTRMLNHHLKKDHKIIMPEIMEHPCPECDKVFRCSTALKKHMYKHTGEELPISCNICDKRFHINSELRDHLLRHAGVKNHVCPYCGVGKTTRQEINKHILTHTREKQFQCRQCDHASHNKQALANHVKVVHMKIKNFACQYCGKTFGKSFACKLHERRHTGENISICKICGKTFLFEKRLIKHLELHEQRDIPETVVEPQGDDGGASQDPENPGEDKAPPAVAAKKKRCNKVERVDISQLAGTVVNPIPSVSVPSWSPQVNFTKKEGQHICPGCGRGFNHIGNMKLHYKVIHEKIKDFACRFCPKRFGKAQYLRHHEYTHTGEKPYVCPVCDVRFAHEASLRRHKETHTKPPRVKKPKPPKKTEHRKRQPKKVFEEFKDPEAERAAAKAQLLAQQQEEHEAKRKKQEKMQKIQQAACEQLQELQKQQLIEKLPYDSFTVHETDTDIVDALKKDISET